MNDKLTKETLIPLGIAVTCCVSLITFACGFYAAFKIGQYQTQQHEEAIKILISDRTNYAASMASIDKTMALFAQRLGAIEKAMPDLHAWLQKRSATPLYACQPNRDLFSNLESRH